MYNPCSLARTITFTATFSTKSPQLERCPNSSPNFVTKNRPINIVLETFNWV